MLLKDKVTIITGGSRGLGKAGSFAFSREGAKVIIASRNSDAGNEIAAQIKEEGGEAVFIQVDIADREQVKAMVDRVIELYGRIDILVNNAGVISDAFVEKMTYEQWDLTINVNLTGTFNCIKQVIPHMIERGYGRIINTSSISGERGARTQVNYASSKAGIIGMTLSLAKELGAKGITVNAVAPGVISTEMLGNVPDKIKNRILEKVPLGRFGEPEEIAAAYVFLASDGASYCNGTILDVHGGFGI